MSTNKLKCQDPRHIYLDTVSGTFLTATVDVTSINIMAMFRQLGQYCTDISR